MEVMARLVLGLFGVMRFIISGLICLQMVCVGL